MPYFVISIIKSEEKIVFSLSEGEILFDFCCSEFPINRRFYYLRGKTGKSKINEFV